MQKDFNDRLTSLSKQAQDNQKDEKAAQQLQSTYMNLQQRMAGRGAECEQRTP